MKKFSDRVISNESNHWLVENELKKLKEYDLNYFKDNNYFEEDGTQNYLVFQPINKYFKGIIDVGIGKCIYFWKSKGLSDGRINSIIASNYIITPSLDYLGAKIRLKFNGSCLREDKITYTHGKIVNIYIVYEISRNYNISDYPSLENCLFGAVSLTKYTDIVQYKYYRYGIGFDRKGHFPFGNGVGRNIIIFGADKSSSVHLDNKKKYILILGKGPTLGLDGITLTAEKLYLVN